MNTFKRCLIYLIFAFIIIPSVIIPSAIAVTVTRQMPQSAEPDSIFEVNLRITNAKEGQLFTLEETRPLQIEITDWNITGATEPKDKIETRKKDLGFGWSFTPRSDEATITYTAKVSASATGDLAFEAIYFDSEGFNKARGSLNVQRKQPAIIKGEPLKSIDSDNNQKSENEKRGEKARENNGEESATIKSAGKGRAILIGALIIASIVIIGIGSYLYATRPKKRRDIFNDKFFRK